MGKMAKLMTTQMLWKVKSSKPGKLHFYFYLDEKIEMNWLPANSNQCHNILIFLNYFIFCRFNSLGVKNSARYSLSKATGMFEKIEFTLLGSLKGGEKKRKEKLEYWEQSWIHSDIIVSSSSLVSVVSGQKDYNITKIISPLIRFVTVLGLKVSVMISLVYVTSWWFKSVFGVLYFI